MGEISALIAAFLWATSSIYFSISGKVFGPSLLNRIRLSFAFIFLIVTHTIFYKTPIPINAPYKQWGWLALSAIIGLVIGDFFLFKSFVMVGPRLGMLIMSTSPVVSALLAWIFLGESLSISQIFGIGLAIGGIALVVTDNGSHQNVFTDQRHKWIGLLFAFGGSIGQAVGLIFAKKGLPPEFPALSGVVIRIMVATIFVWLSALVTRQIKPGLKLISENPKAMKNAFFGALMGPYIGVWLSLVAVQFAKVGIASTLMALTPIFHLPIGSILKEKITKQAIIGTLIAIIGVAVILI